MKRCISEYGVYVKCWNNDFNSDKIGFCLYINDLLGTRSSDEAIVQFKTEMLNEFEMSDLGEPNYFLGIEFTKTKHDVIMELLKRFRMEHSIL